LIGDFFAAIITKPHQQDWELPLVKNSKHLKILPMLLPVKVKENAFEYRHVSKFSKKIPNSDVNTTEKIHG